MVTQYINRYKMKISDYTWFEAIAFTIKGFIVGIIIVFLCWMSYDYGYKESKRIYHKEDTLVVLPTVRLVVTVTSYQPDTLQCDNSPFVTASGHHIVDSSYYRTIAVSKDILYQFVDFNEMVQLEINDTIYDFIVTDIVQGSKRVDVLCPLGIKWSKMIQGKGVLIIKK